MSAPGSCVTPSRVISPSTSVSPVEWMHAFAYTPDSAGARNDNQCREPAAWDRVPCADGDALPTRFHSRPRSRIVCEVLRSSRHQVPASSTPDAHMSDPCLMVPAKRSEQRKGSQTLSSASTSAPDGPSTVVSSTHTGKTSLQTQCTSAVGSPTIEYDQVPTSHSPAAAPVHLRSRRVVLEGVEIIKKRRSRGHVVDSTVVCACGLSDRTCSPPSSRPPSLPVSRAERGDVVHDRKSHAGSPTAAHNMGVSPEAGRALSLKPSKYFTRASTPLTLTPSGSPLLTSSPVTYPKSSGFGFPSQDVSPDQPTEAAAVEPGHVPSWCYSQGAFDDLMIMLRRLKPILVQECVRDDTWKVLIAVRLLNVTTGKAAIPVFCKIISRWPTPQDLVHAPKHELVELLRPLGLYNKRATWLRDMSERFLQDRQAFAYSGTPVASLLSDQGIAPGAFFSQYPGVGPYALDSLHIFCAADEDAWKSVMPRDKELVRYLRWRWAIMERKKWYPDGVGVIGDVDVPYLIMLVDELAAHYDSAIGGEGCMYHFYNDLSEMLNENTAGNMLQSIL